MNKPCYRCANEMSCLQHDIYQGFCQEPDWNCFTELPWHDVPQEAGSLAEDDKGLKPTPTLVDPEMMQILSMMESQTHFMEDILFYVKGIAQSINPDLKGPNCHLGTVPLFNGIIQNNFRTSEKNTQLTNDYVRRQLLADFDKKHGITPEMLAEASERPKTTVEQAQAIVDKQVITENGKIDFVELNLPMIRENVTAMAGKGVDLASRAFFAWCDAEDIPYIQYANGHFRVGNFGNVNYWVTTQSYAIDNFDSWPPEIKRIHDGKGKGFRALCDLLSTLRRCGYKLK